MFVYRRLGLAALGCLVWLAAADALPLDEMPESEACGVMKKDINPGMESKQNRDDLDFMYRGTMKQGRDGDQCGIFRRNREKLKTDRALNFEGIHKHSRERVFAWGRLCLLDWCDMGPVAPPPVVKMDPPTTKEKEENIWKWDHWSQPPAPEEKDPPKKQADEVIPGKKGRPQTSALPLEKNVIARLVICNVGFEGNISLALMFENLTELNPWTITGWRVIQQGRCETFHIQLGGEESRQVGFHLWGRGFAADTKSWNACVPRQGSANFAKLVTFKHSCGLHEQLVGFQALTVRYPTTRYDL